MPRTVAEWIEYHAALGVGHFFIMDDCSTDDGKTRTVLDIYRQEGLVSLYDAEDVTLDECGHLLGDVPTNGSRGEQEVGGSRDARTATTGLKAEETPPEFQKCSYGCQEKHAPNERRLFRFLYRQIGESKSGHHCDWVMTFDIDEYMTFQTDLHPSGNLQAFLVEYEATTHGLPVLHVPWVIMGSDHQEQRPPGLMIDNFRVGNYPAWMVKTAARSAFIEAWDFSHWPKVKNISAADAVTDHGFVLPEPFGLLREYTERNWLLPNESRIIHPEAAEPNVECRYPASPLFLKHYLYRSFEEFQAYRANPASLRVKSDGNQNTKPLNEPRQAWEEGWGVHNPRSFDKGPCAPFYANEFTQAMAERTRTALADRKERWDERHPSSAVMDVPSWGAQSVGRGRGKNDYEGTFPPVEEWVI